MNEPKFTAADLVDAFREGLTLGQKAGAVPGYDGGYAEGYADGADAVRRSWRESDDTVPTEVVSPMGDVEVPPVEV